MVRILSVFVFLILLAGCFDKSDKITLDRISSTREAEDCLVEFTLGDQPASKIQSRISGPYSVILSYKRSGIEVQRLEPHPIDQLWDNQKKAYIFLFRKPPLGPVVVRLEIIDANGIVVAIGQSAFDIRGDIINRVTITLWGNYLSAMTGAYFFDFVQQLNTTVSYIESGSTCYYDADGTLLHTVNQMSRGWDSRVQPVPVPATLYPSGVQETVPVTFEMGKIDEHYYKWIDQPDGRTGLRFIGQVKQSSTPGFFKVVNQYGMYSGLNETRKLSVEASSLTQSIMFADMYLGESYSSSVNGHYLFRRMQGSRILDLTGSAPGVSPAFAFWHPVRVDLKIDFLDLEDVGTFTNCPRFIVTRKIFDQAAGGQVIEETVSDRYFAKGIGVIRDIVTKRSLVRQIVHPYAVKWVEIETRNIEYSSGP